MRENLRRDLTRAIAAHDVVVVSALRSALGAIDNAEAVESTPPPPPSAAHPAIAGSVAGVGAADVERRVLTEADVRDLVKAEVVERLSAALDYECLGHRDRAVRLRAEAKVLSGYLPPS